MNVEMKHDSGIWKENKYSMNLLRYIDLNEKTYWIIAFLMIWYTKSVRISKSLHFASEDLAQKYA